MPHPSAAKGYSRASGTYERGRPGYPAVLVGWLRNDLGLRSGQVVLDLGAGTGKFTGHLTATGADVIAVEPVAEMLAELSRRHSTVRALEGRADSIPLEDESVDCVVCAQAFHWFASDATLAEIRRVLRPGGRLSLIWNVRDEDVAWVARLTKIMAPYEEGTPRFHTGAWRKVFPAEGFSALEEVSFPHTHDGLFEQVVVDRVLSVSFIAALPEATQAKVAAEIRRMASEEPLLATPEAVSFPYSTLCALVHKQS